MRFPPQISSSAFPPRAIILGVGLLVAACLAAPPRARAAAPAGWPEVTPAEKAYRPVETTPEDAVVLFEQGDVDDSPRNGRVQTIHRRLKILSAEGVPRSEIRISYLEPGQDLVGLEGRTITADGRIVVLDPQAIRKGRSSDGVAQVAFQLPEAAPGSIIEYRYTLRGGAAPAMAGWTFQHEIPCLRSSFTWHPSLERTSHWTLLEADSLHPEVVPLTAAAAPESLAAVKFEIRDLPAVPAEVMGPPGIETRARLVTTYTDFAAGATDYWDSFAAAAQERQDLFASQTENLRAALLGSAGAPDDFNARIRMAYDFVQARTRRAGDAGRPTPRIPSTADSVLAAGVTDPDAGDLLFIACLKVLGIAATRGFLVDRDQGFFHREIQSPAQFSRALVAVTPGNGQAFFFSPGTPFNPPGAIPWYTQGVTILLAGSSGAYFGVTPIDAPTVNQTTRTLRFELDGEGNLSAAVHVDYTGQPELEARLKAAADSGGLRAGLESDWKNRLPRAVVDSVKVLNGESLNRNLAVEARLRAERFGVMADDRILFNPAVLGRQGTNPFPPGPRTRPVYFDYPYVSTDNITVTLPAQWKLDTLPESASFDNEVGSYRTVWSYDGEHLVYQRTFALKQARVAPEQYDALRQVYDRMVEGDRELVALVPSPVRASQR